VKISRVLAVTVAVALGLSAASTATAAGLSAAEIEKNFIGKKFTWKHESGAGGKTIHNADGTMVYDTDGKKRTTRWKISGKKFCVNADEADEWCFVLVKKGKTFTSDDGSIVYTAR
jgi:hypothetical protein